MPEPPDPTPEEERAFAPATLQNLENGWFSLYFSCDEFDGELDVVEIFESHDVDPNGYGWESVLAPALERFDAAAFEQIDWSCEADTFVVLCADKAPLLALVEVLRNVVRDTSSLEAAVAAHDPDL